MTAYPVGLQWLGVARETTPGVPMTTPAVFIPIASPKLTSNIAPQPDNALRLAVAETFGQQQGMWYEQFDYSTYLYEDSAFLHFLALYGGADTVAGSADPYLHSASLYDGSHGDGAQPPTYTLFYSDATGNAFRIPGCKLAALTVTITPAGGLATLAVTWAGMPATKVTPPANVPTTASPMPAWTAVVDLAGQPAPRYRNLSLTYERKVEVLPSLAGGLAPAEIHAGICRVTGNLDATYDGAGDADLSGFYANSQPSLTVKLFPAGDTVHYLLLQHSQIAYTAGDVDGSAKAWMQVSTQFTAIANLTDQVSGQGLSPGMVQLASASSVPY